MWCHGAQSEASFFFFSCVVFREMTHICMYMCRCVFFLVHGILFVDICTLFLVLLNVCFFP